MRKKRFAAILFLAALTLSSGASADNSAMPAEGGMIRSMGFPKRWMPRLGGSYILDRSGNDGRGGAELNLSVYRDILNPNLGALGLVTELYGGMAGEDSRGGARLMAAFKFFMFQYGADYSFTDERWTPILSFQFPLKRGGLFGRGGDVRIDWFPREGHSLSFGLNVPIFQPYKGKTRPKSAHVSLPKKGKRRPAAFEPSGELSSTIEKVAAAAREIQDYTTFFLDKEYDLDSDKDIARITEGLDRFREYYYSTDDDYPEGHTFNAAIAVYHSSLEDAFTAAAGGDERLGVDMADTARNVLLDEILLPYDRLLGQRKKDDTVLGFAVAARKRFASGVSGDHRVDSGRAEALEYLFDRLIDIVEENRKILRDDWEDSRLVWLPLHYALTGDDLDTRDGLERIVEKAVGKGFQGGNDIHYVINEQFQWELGRMINAARDYHVLWIHDYRGDNNTGDPDLVAYRMSTEGYLNALINAVKRYDSTGKMPVYMIILDQFYFEAGNGQRFLRLLEDPLSRRIALPAGFEDWEETIEEMQAELRAAVDSSRALSEGKKRYGEKWLRNMVKVQINITNPADFSFRSGNMFKYLWFVPDILFRDHRKISFYDLTELDPGRGEGMFTGMGVGEHYAGPTWDDRAVLASGPAVLGLKTEARKLLISQGFRPEEIPPPLRPLPRPDDYDEQVLKLIDSGWTSSAMQLHNDTGFGQKWDNVLKGVLYSLMPKGSCLLIPDSLWNSTFWGSMLYGAAMRGCRIYVIAPSLANAPSDGLPQMARANELFTRFIFLNGQLGKELEYAGGVFRTGVYDFEGDVQDQIGITETMLRHMDEYEWIDEIFPSHESVRGYMKEAIDILERKGYAATHVTGDAVVRKPKIHLKAQFFTTGLVNRTLLPLAGWGPLIRDYILARAEQTANNSSYVNVKDLRGSLSEQSQDLVTEWAETVSPEERQRIAMFLTVGSQNEDYRGMVMDGEVLFVVSTNGAGVALLDMMNLVLVTTWIDDLETLDELMPPSTGLKYRLSRYIKLAL
jgi:hypothetical protein